MWTSIDNWLYANAVSLLTVKETLPVVTVEIGNVWEGWPRDVDGSAIALPLLLIQGVTMTPGVGDYRGTGFPLYDMTYKYLLSGFSSHADRRTAKQQAQTLVKYQLELIRVDWPLGQLAVDTERVHGIEVHEAFIEMRGPLDYLGTRQYMSIAHLAFDVQTEGA